MARRSTTKPKDDEERLTPPESSTNGEEEAKLTPPKAKKEKGEDAGDYLRKYEFHHPTGRPYFQLPENTRYEPPGKGGKSEIMKNSLLGQPRVKIFIPREQNESKEILKSVTLNGYRLDLPKNQYLELPKQIVDVLMESLQQGEIALEQDRISGDSKKEDALL